MIARVTRITRTIDPLRALDLAVISLLSLVLLLAWFSCWQRGVAVSQLMMCGVSLLLFLVLTLPWDLRTQMAPPRLLPVVGAGCCLLAGVAGELMILVACGWTLALGVWLDMRLPADEMRRVRRLLPLTLFVLPWIELDVAFLSLALRQSVATVAQNLLAAGGVLEVRSDTLTVIAGQPISITGDCDGRDTLQAMILVGLASAYFFLGPRRPIWIWLPLLVGFAWLANLLRVLMMGVGAVYLDLRIHGAILHDGGGWLTVVTMLGLCAAFFQTLRCVNQAIPAASQDVPAAGCKVTEPVATAPTAARALRDEPPVGAADRGGDRLTYRQLLLWGLLFCCLLIGFVASSVSPSKATSRLEQIREQATQWKGKSVPLTETDARRLGDAEAIKLVVPVAGRRYLLTAIDGTKNRHAVHDPTYCYEVLQAAPLPVRGGEATSLRVVEDGREKDVLFWFTTGTQRHASPARYLLQTSLRRATLGGWGREPLLVIIEPLDGGPVNWFRFLDQFGMLAQL